MEKKKKNKTASIGIIADYGSNPAQKEYIDFRGILPILPLRNMIVFPGVIMPLAIGRESSGKLVEWAEERGPEQWIVLGVQYDEAEDAPSFDSLYSMGVLARVLKTIRLPEDKTSVIVQAANRVRLIKDVHSGMPFMEAEVETVSEPEEPDDETAKASRKFFCNVVEKFIEASDEHVSGELKFAFENMKGSWMLFNFMMSNLPLKVQDKMSVLQICDPLSQMHEGIKLLNIELKRIKLIGKIQEQTMADLSRQQREYYLQQEIRNINKELGTDENTDIIRFRTTIENLLLPPKVQENILTELARLERMNPASPEYNISYTYIRTVLSLPWNAGNGTPESISTARARKILDKDHYGMERVKERILEHLAVMAFSKSERAPILCLVGPPGVGKTSLGRSIAHALQRQYVRISLGGMHDESEIRGHRRTYIGAMCGRIMKSMIKCGVRNPVFVLDEIDKVGGNSHNGNPQSALLELLDPEQNNAFHDNYLDFDFDLSRVFFIATANNLGDIPTALRDRMEIIEVDGYMTEEKIEIARRHLIPDAIEEMALPLKVRPTTKALESLVEGYTRESGVRHLKHLVSKIIRRIVLENAELSELPRSISIKPNDVTRLLGNPKFTREKYEGNGFAGVVTGLAWTAAGGEILFIETSLSRSKAPRLTTTGNLGDIMKESASLALEYIKANADTLDLDSRLFEQWAIHVHVPEGATPKDGPSAGITIATSMVSALTQRRVKKGIAMTGEITLRGKVLPIGGVKEKLLAARRAGINTIFLPEGNRNDVLEIPARYTQGLQLEFVSSLPQVWNAALLTEKVEHPKTFAIEDTPTEK